MTRLEVQATVGGLAPGNYFSDMELKRGYSSAREYRGDVAKGRPWDEELLSSDSVDLVYWHGDRYCIIVAFDEQGVVVGAYFLSRVEPTRTPGFFARLLTMLHW
jgi:hypothetical protein